MTWTFVLLAVAGQPPLPPPNATPSVNNPAKVIGWPAGKIPAAPPGFAVTAFADVKAPRWMYSLPNGDLLVAHAPKPAPKGKSAGPPQDEISLVRTDAGGKQSVTPFAVGQNKPLGMLLVGPTLYIANTDAVWAYSYAPGQEKIEAPRKVMDLPLGGYNNHWTRNIVAGKNGKLYVTVGSASNVAENGTGEELLRANVLEMNPDGTALRVFASGLRNPVGLDWEPVTGKLWAAVNERDHLGDDLVPDYLTAVADGGFYGWPFAYFGPNEDPRRKGERPDLVAKTLVPDVAMGPHTASLGLTFYRGPAFPEKYRGGAFVGQRGSWNRSQFAGYRVVFVPFKDGKPSGPFEDFLTGFIANDREVYGRPVGVIERPDGSLLVADEGGDRIWRVAAGAK